MLLTAIKIKLVALVAVAGLNTDDMKGISPDMVKTLESLAADQKAAQEKPGSVDVNAALTKAVEKVAELAKAGDPDANYALGKWAVLGLFQNASAEAAMGSYKVAADKGLADAANLLEQPELAVRRVKTLLSIHGIDG